MIAKNQCVFIGIMHIFALFALVIPSYSGAIALLIGWLATGGFGISLGYHRLLTHRSYSADPHLSKLLALLGCLAWQGGPITWVGFHRAHHRHEDHVGDPHAASCGFWWSHMGWTFFKGPNGYRPRKQASQLADLTQDPWLLFLERYHLKINIFFTMLVTVAIGWKVALWAVPLRVVVVWHLTWIVNSISHGAGKKFKVKGASSARNHKALALLNFGESLHENHHRFPTRPAFVLRQGEVDSGWILLKALHWLGLVQLKSRSIPSMDEKVGFQK